MRSVVLALVAFVALVTSAVGQVTQAEALRYQAKHDEGIQALLAGKNEEGIAAFKACLEIAPEDPNSAYNIACGYAKNGDTEQAFEWLGKAADWGFGNSDGQEGSNVEWTKKDADLESLRADPRFNEIVGRMAAMRKAIEDYVATPEIYIPAALADAESMPVLVLLHDARKTKQSVLTDRWKSIADEIGTAIIAPSGKLASGVKPDNGMSWFEGNLPAYTQRYWTFEKPVDEAVKKFRAEHTIDSSRLFLAGEGEGGLVAFNIAIAAPGLYKGVVVIDSPIHPQLAQPKAANAAKMGFKGRLLVTDAVLGVDGAQQMFDAMKSQFEGWGLDATITTVAADPDGAKLREALVAALRSLEPAPAAAAGG